MGPPAKRARANTAGHSYTTPLALDEELAASRHHLHSQTTETETNNEHDEDDSSSAHSSAFSERFDEHHIMASVDLEGTGSLVENERDSDLAVFDFKEHKYDPTRIASEIHILPPNRDKLKCSCSKGRAHGLCRPGHCGCQKWGSSCSAECACAGRCSNPLKDLERFFGRPGNKRTYANACFTHWLARTKDPETVPLEDIVAFLIEDGQRSAAFEYDDDLIKWKSEWQAVKDNPPEDKKRIELAQQLARYALADEGRWSFWYSFCYSAWVERACTSHCWVCRECIDWREWHCSNCNKCAPFQSIPCESYGGVSELYHQGHTEWM